MPRTDIRSAYWHSGLLLRPGHYHQLERYIETLHRYAITFQGDRFGLLADGGQPSPIDVVAELTPDAPGAQLVVRVKSCLAVTPGGAIITIGPIDDWEAIPEAQTEVDPIRRASIDVVVEVDYENKVPLKSRVESEPSDGIACASPQYKIHLIPSPARDLPPCSLKIAEVIVESGKIRMNSQFLPSCVSMNAHPRLLEEANNILEDLIAAARESTRLIGRLHNDQTIEGAERRVESSLALFHCCQAVTDAVDGVWDRWRHALSNIDPYEWCLSIMALARAIGDKAPFARLAEDKGIVETFRRHGSAPLPAIKDLEGQTTNLREWVPSRYRLGEFLLLAGDWSAALRRLMEGLGWLLLVGPPRGEPSPNPASQETEIEYKGKRFALAEYTSREVSQQGRWHRCLLRGVNVIHAAGILIEIDASLLSAQSLAARVVRVAPRAEEMTMRMTELDLEEIANRSGRLYVLYPDIQQTEVRELTLVSQVLAGLSELPPSRDDRIRIYYQYQR